MTTPQRTLAQLAKEAIEIQDACNPLGLTKAYARAIQELYEIHNRQIGTDDLNHHPINKMWIHKLASLAYIDIAVSDNTFSEAYSWCNNEIALAAAKQAS